MYAEHSCQPSRADLTMPSTVVSPVETAARLRLAIVRTARRLRQEAGERADAVDRGRACDDRAARPARAERACRARARQAADDHARRRAARGGRAGRADGRPRRRARLPGVDHPRGLASCCAASARRKNAYLARRLSKLDPDDLARARARGGRARGHPRGRSPVTRGPAPLLRLPPRAQLPALLRRSGRVSLSGNWMQMVAETWLILEPDRQRRRGRPDRGRSSSCRSSSSAPRAACSPTAIDKRRLLMLTQAVMAVPALVLLGLTAAGAIEPWMVFGARLRAGQRQRRRQPDAAELRDRDGRPEAARQRGQPQQRDRPLLPDRRTGARRPADRRPRASSPASRSTPPPSPR